MQNNKLNNKALPWQLNVFSWIGVSLSSIFLLFILLIIKLGIEGFKAGEMGAMIGIFSIVGLIFLIPILILTVFVVIGNFKQKKWTFIASLVFSIIGLVASIRVLTLGFIPFILIFSIMGFTIWLNIFCLQHINKNLDA